MNRYDVALIGGSGFFGQHLIRMFRDSGLKLLVLGRSPVADTAKAAIDWQFHDLRDGLQDPPRSDVGAVVKTVVFNAGVKGRFPQGSAEWVEQGVVSAPDFQRLFSRVGIEAQRLITIGSSEEYGPDSGQEEISEDREPAPVSSYGYWKNELRIQAQRWSQREGKPFLHLRPFVVYGPGQDHNMFLGSMIRNLLRHETFRMTAGEQWRSFLHIDTLVRVIAALVRKDVWTQSVLNVSDADYRRIIDVANLVHRLVARGRLDVGAIPYRDGEVWHQKPSLRALHETVGELPCPNFEAELGRLIEFEKSRSKDS